MNEKRLIEIGVIGLGNCGGQLADLACGEGFKAIAINASSKDLDLLKNDITTFPVGDGKGTGKNRAEARDFFREQLTLVKDETFIGFIMSCDVIMIAASTGGGFGSGASLTLTDILCKIYPDKLFIPVGILPFDDEGYTAQDHTVEWLKELRTINMSEDGDISDKMNISYMLYDNNRFAGKPQKQVCDIVNTRFVQDLEVMSGMYVSETRTGGTDERDIMTGLSVPGRIVVDSMNPFEESDIIEDSIMKTIKSHIKKESAHADMADDKEILASITFYTLDDNFDNYKPAIKAEMQDVFGEHITDYSNFADTEVGDDENSIAVVLSGLSDPTLRIDRIINKRQKLEDDILGRKKASSKLNTASAGNSKLKLGSKSFADAKKASSDRTDEVLKNFMH